MDWNSPDPKAAKAQRNSRARDVLWWPAIQITATRVLLDEPNYGVNRFRVRVAARYGHFLTKTGAYRWEADLSQLPAVWAAFAPAVHLSPGAWVALEEAGITPSGNLVSTPEDNAALARGEITREEILARARDILKKHQQEA